nr:MAG TPA: hypothetical protein [Caudoviricetes sp.]
MIGSDSTQNRLQSFNCNIVIYLLFYILYSNFPLFERRWVNFCFVPYWRKF